LRLSNGIYENSEKDLKPFDGNWIISIQNILKTIKEQQKGTIEDSFNEYSFQRETLNPTETLHHGRHCAPSKRCGLSKSPFRPSDDACTLPFPIAANAYAVVELRKVSLILRALQMNDLAMECIQVSNEIDDGIKKFGIVKNTLTNQITYAFEVDGYGSSYFIDDANIPSLLSLPYLGYVGIEDPIYKATRKFVLSNDNPFFFEGKASRGYFIK
jgi:uncharacterized protein